MSLPNMIFLGLVLSAFAFFAVMLFSVHIWVNLPAKPPSKAARAPDLRPIGLDHATGAAE